MADKLYGTYTVIPCKHSEGPDRKAELIKRGINHLFAKMSVWDIVPDFNTMQFLIHETVHLKKALDWYLDENSDQIDCVDEVITVGVKYKSSSDQ